MNVSPIDCKIDCFMVCVSLFVVAPMTGYASLIVSHVLRKAKRWNLPHAVIETLLALDLSWVFFTNAKPTLSVGSSLKTCRFSWIEWLMTAILHGCIEGVGYIREMG